MSLQIGDIAPNFNFIDKNGNTRKLHDLPGKKIVFFFPKAFTAGCTRQSISMQENYQDIKKSGVTEIFGISTDGEAVLSNFCRKYDFEYIMVSDKNFTISKKYGVLRNKLIAKIADRVTFIIDENNKITEILNNGILGRGSNPGLDKHGLEVKNYLNI
ncbi:MAG: peroxiredoxin [Candidatus Heimdallarchaeota archaeon]|nr:peroxiredoxin [Candidatus Heimdallarchaeota archaeon]